MLKTGIALASMAALALLLPPSTATGQWANSRGGPERDGARTGTGDLPVPQVKWRQDLGGNVGGASLWQVPDPVVPRIAIAASGRVSLKRWDDSLSWQGQLFGLTRFIAGGDLDGDSAVDLLFATGGSNESMIVGYTPDGELAFSTTGQLGAVSSGARIIDLDGDGFRDLYVTSVRQGPTGAIAAAYRFPNGDPNAAELMYTLDGGERDYSGGFFDVIAELDGTPGLEILALGHRNVYLYDAATGDLESQTTLSGFVPFSRASLRVVDLDLDGTKEIFAFSNQAWSENNNRRHVTLLAHSTGGMSEVWSRNLGNDAGARIQFSDTSVTNLDGTGELEVVFAVRDGNGDWITEIRDAATGVLLDTIIGERFEDVVIASPSPLLFTHDDETPLRSYRFSRANGAERIGVHADLRLIRCRQDRPTVHEVPRELPCMMPVAGQPRRGVVAGEYNPITNATTALVALDTSSTMSEVARFDGRGGILSAVIEIEPGHRAVIAVSHSDGMLLPLDERLRFLAPSPKPPFSWAGVQAGGRFSGFDLPGFPLVAGSADGAERVATLAGAGRATILDASGDVSVVAGVETVWSAGNGDRMVFHEPTNSLIVLDRFGDITALDSSDGSELWRIVDAFDGDRPLHNDPLIVTDDSASPATNQLWFHRRNNNTGVYDLTAIDLNDGSIALQEPNLDANDGGWKRLALATWDGRPAPISGRIGQLWRFDLDGTVAAIEASPLASLVVPITRVGENPLFLIDGRNELAVYDPVTAMTLWSIPRSNGSGARRGATLNIAGRSQFATVDANTPIFRAFDVETGAIDFQYNLVGGELRDVAAPLPAQAPLLGNVTAITDLTGAGDPAYLLGSTDGFIYAIGALDGELLWTLFVGEQVGEIVPADWDGDERLELVVSTADGSLLGIDQFTGNGPAWVHDTDGISTDDIDELETESTLHVAWAEVPNATSYEVAVFTNDSQPVTAGFADVGARTEMTLTNLPLEAGVRYIVSVRAISSQGVSPDKPSDGVTIIPPSDGDSGGCCQVSGSPRGGLETMILAALCVLLTWRRRRHPSP